MIFNDPNYCMGNRSAWKKFSIALGILRNPLVLLADKLGLVKQPRYRARTGVVFYARGRTTDVNDAVVVLSGNEYPPALVNITGLDKAVVLDCGGHIGTFSLYAHKLNPTARFYIMEPSSDNIAMLKKNLAANNVTAVIIDKALYGAAGRYYLDIDDKPFDAGQLVREIPQGHKHLTIDAVTIQDVLEQNGLSRIDLLKMDIEGSEYDVVENGANTWDRK